MTTDIKPSEVVFFFGAGASVAAGVPDTYSFVKEFIRFIESSHDRGKKITIENIVEVLKSWRNSDIDVELLLETLTKLKDRYQEPLLQFFENLEFILKEEVYIDKQPLIEDLKDFIKSKIKL